MASVIISLGSNYRQAVHIQWASERLAHLLSDVRFSQKRWTQDIHHRGIWYMNRLVTGRTTMSVDSLQRTLKAIEAETLRSPDRVTIDLDMMLYDRQRYHLKDWSREYIQLLIDDIL